MAEAGEIYRVAGGAINLRGYWTSEEAYNAAVPVPVEAWKREAA
jgi:hypothetical protein